MAENEIITEKKVTRKRGNPKGTCPATDVITAPGDNARYLRHAMAAYNLPAIDISDPNQVEKRINWYFNHCIEGDMKPTVNGLANALGVHRDTLHNWATGEVRASTHYDLIKKAYSLLTELWEDYMMNGKINPVAGIFIGKNHFKYTNKQEVVLTPNNPFGETESPEDVRKKYIEDNPELLGLIDEKEK